MCCVLTSVGWGSLGVCQRRVLDESLAAATAACVAAVAACAVAVAIVVAVVAAAIAPRVPLAGPSVSIGVGVCCHARNRVAVSSLLVGAGVSTLGAGHTAIVGRAVVVFCVCVVATCSGVVSTLGAGACGAVTDRVICVVMCCTLGGGVMC